MLTTTTARRTVFQPGPSSWRHLTPPSLSLSWPEAGAPAADSSGATEGGSHSLRSERPTLPRADEAMPGRSEFYSAPPDSPLLDPNRWLVSRLAVTGSANWTHHRVVPAFHKRRNRVAFMNDCGDPKKQTCHSIQRKMHQGHPSLSRPFLSGEWSEF